MFRISFSDSNGFKFKYLKKKVYCICGHLSALQQKNGPFVSNVNTFTWVLLNKKTIKLYKLKWFKFTATYLKVTKPHGDVGMYRVAPWSTSGFRGGSKNVATIIDGPVDTFTRKVHVIGVPVFMGVLHRPRLAGESVVCHRDRSSVAVFMYIHDALV